MFAPVLEKTEKTKRDKIDIDHENTNMTPNNG